MKRLTAIVTAVIIGVATVSTQAVADPAKGQKLYLKKLKKKCGINGSKMAAKHTQAEWEAIGDGDRLDAEIKKICPKVKKIKSKYLPDLYDFFHEYASDSGNVPAC